ncbi:membrane carboxypeptidase [Candidatus Scalindua japonica]|uniref:Membrane carboxypeptidase n=1 Tax=Candidatus Scalindua japonica TaxID=1284222 RepID=A0A286U3Z8_9BACT|nr:hypothetical protein [Candidatus Scalindua japonica]GAX62846.1 membrane carboxypeptidase [Candidatus Scalindua japonica]
MRNNVNIGSDMGKLILEGMMTVFIVLIFLFIAQNWVLTDDNKISFTPTCRLSGDKPGISESVPYKPKKIINNDILCEIRFDN